jgi:hypothetical protein
MRKHAYLFIAHSNWDQLSFLISLLNDTRNDFFILIDSKAKDFDKKIFIESCKTDNITIVEPVKIYWGDYSQIQAELTLLKTATSTGCYGYYHLLSAVDLPLKSQDEIHAFFDANQGEEFVDFDSYKDISQAKQRVGYYYPFQKLIGRHRKHLLKYTRDFILLLEELLKINRNNEIKQFLGKGANWFSITDDFARYVVDHEEFIQNHFHHTFCADEVFLQTLLKMSPYSQNWYGFKNKNIQYQNLRYCDWGRGKPYTFSKDEYFSLCNYTDYIFARKFSKDSISEDIKKYLLSPKTTKGI